MAPKRKHQESESQDPVHASRQAQVYGSTSKPFKKPRNSEPPVYRKQAHTSSVNAIKKRIRDVSRRLERSDDLPANVRVEDERALNAFHQELAAAKAEKLRQKMIKKYHMVRFFERQKATRQLKKLRKLLLEAKTPEEVEKLKSQMRSAEVDLNYTQYFPLTETYVSLYPQNKVDSEGSKAKTEGTGSKPPMWAEVEQCMEEGTLDQLRHRVPKISVDPPRKLQIKAAKQKPPPAPVETIGLNRRERRSQLGVKEHGKTKHKSVGFEKNKAFGHSIGTKSSGSQAGDEHIDGGFFEE